LRPRGLKANPIIFSQQRDGTFTDVSEKAGVSDKDGFYGFTATFVDINNDERSTW